MSQPVKLSDELILDARTTSRQTERSIAGQIEFWARLGRALEPLLSGNQTLALKESGDRKKLSELLSTVEDPVGKNRLAAYLDNRPFPHYEVASERPGLLLRIDENGDRTLGKFVNKKFQPLEADPKKKTNKK